MRKSDTEKMTVTRAYDFEVRAKHDDEHGYYLEGRPIIYGSRTDLGYFDEIIEPGALGLILETSDSL